MKHSHDFTPDNLNIHHAPTGMNDRIALGVGRCCKSLTTKDSLCESMALDAVHEQAIPRPLSHDELVQLQRVAQEAGVSAHLGRQGHDLARGA
jgi:hypothetical protein